MSLASSSGSALEEEEEDDDKRLRATSDGTDKCQLEEKGKRDGQCVEWRSADSRRTREKIGRGVVQAGGGGGGGDVSDDDDDDKEPSRRDISASM